MASWTRQSWTPGCRKSCQTAANSSGSTSQPCSTWRVAESLGLRSLLRWEGSSLLTRNRDGHAPGHITGAGPAISKRPCSNALPPQGIRECKDLGSDEEVEKLLSELKEALIGDNITLESAALQVNVKPTDVLQYNEIAPLLKTVFPDLTDRYSGRFCECVIAVNSAAKSAQLCAHETAAPHPADTEKRTSHWQIHGEVDWSIVTELWLCIAVGVLSHRC